MSQRAARLQRARGALLGRLVGEALGATTQHLPPESLAARLRIGHELAVWIDALERELKGAVREIAPEADPASRTVTVKVTLPQTSGLTSGLFGRLRIPIGQTQALVIPQAAVRQVGQLDLVEVVDASGRARRRFVTLGRARPPEVEVRSGLAEGDQVLLRD